MSPQNDYFKCSLCSYFSVRKYDLKRHEKIHGDNYKCKHCQGSFITFIGLEKHLKCCKADGVYVDERRSIDGRKVKEDPDEESLEGSRTSVKDPEEEEIERSLIESLKAITEDYDEDELLVERPKPKPKVIEKVPPYDERPPPKSLQPPEYYTCPKCPYKTKRNFDLRRHLTIHGGSYRCAKCKSTFNTIIGFKTHIKTHDNRIHKKIEELKNPKKAVDPKKISLATVKVKNGRFCCPQCDETFTILKNLKRHQLCHSDQKRYECSYCPQSFKRQDYLLDHERRHQYSTRLLVTKDIPIPHHTPPIPRPKKKKFKRSEQSKHSAQVKRIEMNQKISQAKKLVTRIKSQPTERHAIVDANVADTILDDFNPDEEFFGLLEEIKNESSNSRDEIVTEEFEDFENVPKVKEEPKEVSVIQSKSTKSSVMKAVNQSKGAKVASKLPVKKSSRTSRGASSEDQNANKKRPYGCEECPMAFGTQLDLWFHKRAEHPV